MIDSVPCFHGTWAMLISRLTAIRFTANGTVATTSTATTATAMAGRRRQAATIAVAMRMLSGA